MSLNPYAQPLTALERLQRVQQTVEASVANHTGDLRAVIQHIYNNPELAFEEYIAHDTICDFLEKLGFKVTRNAFGVKTAFEALSGEGGRLISIDAEYDALPEIGHGCGHHLIAATSITAFLGVHYALQKHGVAGRIQLLGCPAEENQGGKVVLTKNGAMKGVDAAIMAHPISPEKADPSITAIGGLPTLAMQRWVVEYHGRASHAAGHPHKGLNAFDAAVAAYNNIAFLRQQTLSEERIHGCVLEGPKVPNTIGHYTKSVWIARSLNKGTLLALSKRVLACFEAAAIATGCTVTITEGNMYTDTIINETLCNRYTEIANSIEGQNARPFNTKVETGSTDFGNFTYECPGIHVFYMIKCSPEIFAHHQNFTQATGTDDAFHRAVQTGTLLALTTWDLLTDDLLFEQAKKEWEASVKENTQE
ncbi:hypothetical protein N7462_010128 [Penicillium macrosclerotiorum]|uniref:uncharacterized protein n=1 Tax=Penicillium macrosclerotiorum TaxID=303699 RepID=UPI0025491129|nr:uncharacterized protein N7462_010128 [Penicillium macrosclerotiorum]KAJ5669058.1 hypothetical protein N7462_010128 [Penicillium macrosclerotiorum]